MSSSVLHKYFGSVVTIVCALLFAATSFAQTSKFAEYHKIFTDYTSHHLQEKIFVHTDRSFYLCGEILWFKAYLMNAATNKPLSISKVVYVEIMNNKHDPHSGRHCY